MELVYNLDYRDNLVSQIMIIGGDFVSGGSLDNSIYLSAPGGFSTSFNIY